MVVDVFTCVHFMKVLVYLREAVRRAETLREKAVVKDQQGKL